jgi:hypothetical protein
MQPPRLVAPGTPFGSPGVRLSRLERPRLDSLPPDPLRTIFDLLSFSPGVAGVDSPDALALASTCRALSGFYREDYATTFSVTYDDRPCLPNFLSRALARLPQASRVSVERFSGEFQEGVCGDDERAFLGSEKRGWEPTVHTQRVTRLKVSLRDSNTGILGKEFSVIVRACANLKELVIADSRCIRDDVGVQVGGLRLLETLDLSGCTALTDASFSVLGQLAQTLEDVTLTRTRISNSCAMSLLPRLRRLRRLSVRRCWPLTAAIVPQLPETLTHLNIGGTQVLDVSIRPSLLQAVPLLDSLHVSGAWHLTDISALWSVRLQLKELVMSDCRRLADGALRSAIAGMDKLERLELSNTRAGDETARGVACLPKLSYLDVSSTYVTYDGVLLLAAGKVCRTLTTVVIGCRRNDEAIDVLRAALGGRTALILRGIRYALWPGHVDAHAWW